MVCPRAQGKRVGQKTPEYFSSEVLWHSKLHHRGGLSTFYNEKKTHTKGRKPPNGCVKEGGGLHLSGKAQEARSGSQEDKSWPQGLSFPILMHRVKPSCQDAYLKLSFPQYLLSSRCVELFLARGKRCCSPTYVWIRCAFPELSIGFCLCVVFLNEEIHSG